jgi:hypothetical protein
LGNSGQVLLKYTFLRSWAFYSNSFERSCASAYNRDFVAVNADQAYINQRLSMPAVSKNPQSAGLLQDLAKITVVLEYYFLDYSIFTLA